MNALYDLIIIGGGPAGITAGIYAARQNLKTLLISKSFGGQMARKTVAIDNYTGFEEISGIDLVCKFEKHLKKQKIDIEVDIIEELKKENGKFYILTGKGKRFESLAVIVASGAEPRTLCIPGENEFIGRGVSYCVACDGPVFTGKTVAVIGGGDAGFEAALFLSEYTKKVYIMECGQEAKASVVLQEKTQETGKIETITNAVLKNIQGEKFVECLEYQDLKNNQLKKIEVKGVFVEIGNRPAVSFVRDLVDFNDKKEIIIDNLNNQTKTAGLFAAGDVTNTAYKQIIISAGEGAKAAMSAHKYLLETKK
jgi:thioredoxin-disulfide reductase